VYNTLSWLAGPAVCFHLAGRLFRGRESKVSLVERWGISFKIRPQGAVIWFHAVSIGESAVALPVLHRCLQEHINATVLFTTSTAEAYSLLQNALPERTVLQFAPLDVPWVVDRFLDHWRPEAAVFVESELWPNLICRARDRGVALALLNARMSNKSFLRWHNWTTGRDLARSMLSCFSLIIPQSDLDVASFRLLGAELWQMPGWCADLKYAAAMGACVWQMWRPSEDRVELLRRAVGARDCWVAASTHSGEDPVIGQTHLQLLGGFPALLTIIAPRHPWRCGQVQEELRAMGLSVCLWSSLALTDPDPLAGTDVLLVDAVGELPLLFAVAEIVFVGGSMFEGSKGHNLAEAAVAACAVLVGPYAGHFSQMADELNAHAHEESFASEQQSPPRPPSSSSSAALPSPMRRLGTPDAARALLRRREAPSEELPYFEGGLRSLEDELSGRHAYMRRGRRMTRTGSTPGSWWASPEQSPRLHQARRLNASPGSSDHTGGRGRGSNPSPRSRLSTASTAPRPSGSHSSTQPTRFNQDDLTVSDSSAECGSPMTPQGQQQWHGLPGAAPSPAPSAARTTSWSPGSPLDAQGGGSPAAAREANASTPASEGYCPSVDSEGPGVQVFPMGRAPVSLGNRPLPRFPGERLLPAHRLPGPPIGPCVWTVSNEEELVSAVRRLLLDPLERRSRGKAAAQASASLASNLVTSVWELLDSKVISPKLGSGAER